MRFFKYLIVAFLLLSASAAGAQTIRQRAAGMADTQKYEMCKSTANGGSSDAIEWCSIALEGPLNAQRKGYSLAHRAIAYEKAGNNQAALDDLNAALPLVGTVNSTAYVLDLRGQLLYLMRRYPAAVDDFSVVLRSQATVAGVWHKRGMAWFRIGIWNLAIQDFSQSIKLGPANAETMHYRGLAYLQKKQWDEAIADYSQAIRLDPTNALSFKGRSTAYFGKFDYSRAISDLNEFSRLQPNDPAGPYGRGLVYELTHDFDRAMQEFDAALRLAPNHPDALQARKRAEARKKTMASWGPVAPKAPGSASPAATTNVEALKAAGSTQQARMFVGKAIELISKGDLAAAVAAYREAVRLQPDEIGHRTGLARTLIDTGQFANAIPEIEMAVTKFPDRFWYRFMLTEALGGAGRKSDALAQLAMAAKAGAPPASVQAAREKMLGREAAAKGDYAAAIPHFLKANALAPKPDLTDDRIQVELAFALARTGQKEAALKVMEVAALRNILGMDPFLFQGREKLIAEIGSAKAAGSQPATAALAPAASAPAPASSALANPNTALAAQKYEQGNAAWLRFDKAGAFAAIEEAVRLAPENHQYLSDLAIKYCADRKYEASIPHYQAAIKLKPNDPFYHANLAEALAELGRKEDAMREADLAISLAPNNAYAIASRNRVVAKLRSKTPSN